MENGTRLKGITRLKGELYGNPALQGGGAGAASQAVWRTAPA